MASVEPRHSAVFAGLEAAFKCLGMLVPLHPLLESDHRHVGLALEIWSLGGQGAISHEPSSTEAVGAEDCKMHVLDRVTTDQFSFITYLPFCLFGLLPFCHVQSEDDVLL